MALIIVIVIGIFSGLVFIWLSSRKNHLNSGDVARGVEQAAAVLTWILPFLMMTKARERAFPLGVVGAVAVGPVILAAEQRRKLSGLLDRLEEAKQRIGARLEKESNLVVLKALGELTAELTTMRVAAQSAHVQALPALEEKAALWLAQVGQAEAALFGLGALLCEVEMRLHQAYGQCTDETLRSALGELAGKVGEWAQVEVSFQRPEVTRSLILELTQAKALLVQSTGKEATDEPAKEQRG